MKLFDILLKAAFRSQVESAQCLPKTSWIASLKKCLNQIGLGNIWQSILRLKVHSMDVSLFSQRLKDIYEQDWYATLHDDERTNQKQKKQTSPLQTNQV
jgi:hypothetical protein